MHPSAIAASLLVPAALFASSGRLTIALDGEWDIEDSSAATAIPPVWRHRAPVPGLANLARPAFPHVDEYLSIDNIYDQLAFGLLQKNKPLPKPGPRQDRYWFWYRRTFRVPARHDVALLRIGKAQFSTAVWLNGQNIGEHLGCFTAGIFDLTRAIDWTGENTLIVRVGAHPGVMPDDVPSGTDFEKSKWTPGIYDRVTLVLADNPVIETVQVAPRIDPPAITIESTVRNYSDRAVSARLTHTIRTWRGNVPASGSAPLVIELPPHQVKTVRQDVGIPRARLWSPEDPFLYVVESSTSGDSVTTRFGVREFRFDDRTRRAFLNGRPYYLRGTNITLHRFFEDPDAGARPWDEKWLHRLLVEIPKSMSWNAMRFCIGPAPDRWLEIADEAGLLIQNEYPIWTGAKSWPVLKRRSWNADELVIEYKEWLRDNWNHPSVVIWDANNETEDEVFAAKVIPEVRGLDLSNRPWENSYSGPAAPGDPVEDHPYLFARGTTGPGKIFDIAELETMRGDSSDAARAKDHAMLLNEYGWLWLLRDGSPCVVSKKVYDTILGENATPEERLELNHYYLAGLTEYWRAWRHYAGVLHFVYLTFCYPNAYTCDNFKDVRTLDLHPQFIKYVREAFKPLGVYINFWRPSLETAARRSVPVMLVNDYAEPVSGTVVLSFEDAAGREPVRVSQPFSMPADGRETIVFEIGAPGQPGQYLLKAVAMPAAGPAREPTISRRKVRVHTTAPAAPDPFRKSSGGIHVEFE